jgi:hypothetical protein
VTCRYALPLAVIVALGAAPAGPVCAQEIAPGSADQDAAKPETLSSTASPSVAREPGRPHAFEMSVSFVVLGPSSLGSRTATLTPNQAGSAPPYTLFAASAQLQTAPGFDVRMGYAVTRAVVVEGGMTYSRPGVSLTVTQDAENAEGFSSTGESLSQFSFDATVRIHLKRLSFRGGRGRPYVAAGAGYLRQLHEGAIAVDTGVVYSFGGGLIYLLQAQRVRLLPGLAMQGVGLRADVRGNIASGGFSFDGRNRVYAGASVGLFIGF